MSAARPVGQRLWRQPLAHFVVLGAVLFVLYAAVQPNDPASGGGVRLDRAALRGLATDWQARTGRLPDAREMAVLVEERLREELLFREAVALNLHQGDAVIRGRLAGLLQTAWTDAAMAVAPDEDELRAYFVAHRNLYREPLQLTISHRYFGSSQRGEAAQATAQAALVDLQAGRRVVDDAYPVAKTLTLRSSERLTERFGAAFARRVLERARQGVTAQWFGPLASDAGWHLVRIDGFEPEHRLSFAAARRRVESDWRRDFVARERARRLTELRGRYGTDVASFGTVSNLVAE